MKVCLDCRSLYRPGPGARRGRCADCERAKDKARGTREERGYGAEHRATRERWAPLVATGNVKCWRCGEFIPVGAPFDLGHDDRDRTKYRGPEHVTCNRATAARRC